MPPIANTAMTADNATATQLAAEMFGSKLCNFTPMSGVISLIRERKSRLTRTLDWGQAYHSPFWSVNGKSASGRSPSIVTLVSLPVILNEVKDLKSLQQATWLQPEESGSQYRTGDWAPLRRYRSGTRLPT